MPDGPLGDQSIDPLVIWVFVAGVVIALLLVLSTAAFKSDRSGLALSPPSPPTAKTDCQKLAACGMPRPTPAQRNRCNRRA